jgi:hypothetical protein
MSTQAPASNHPLRLFTSPSAFPNPQRLRIFLHEKGIADQFDERIYDMTPVGEHRQWRHLKMNPWGETPTLELLDGSFISETAAVVRYLDQTFPGRRIMGETPEQQGLDTMWDNRIWVHILYRIVTAFHVLHQGLGPKLELTTNHEGGASIAARRCWPMPASSTSTCRTVATGCWAATSQHSRTSPWRPRSLSPSFRSTRPRSTSASSISMRSGSAGSAGSAGRPSWPLRRPKQRRTGTG